MRFLRLQIPAFGPFTNLELAFRGGAADFHVIHGPNEAGKSSLLRSIRDLLFGIPAQSADDFQHKYNELRIAAELSNRSGDTLVFQRRKGNKNTLLDAAGNILPDTALAPFLGGVDEAYFRAMFGLGSAELAEGARQLLRGEGDMGQALFSASLGGTPIQKVLETLREQAERLHKPRATVNVTIRPTVQRYKEFIRLSREAMVNPESFDALEQELADAEAQQRAGETQIARFDEELARIERWEAALPMVSRLTVAQQQLSLLPALPELSSDFASRVRAARTAVSNSQAEVQHLVEWRSKLQTQVSDTQESPAILAQADLLNRLHEELGAYRAAKSTLDECKIKVARLEPLLRSGMERLELKGEFTALGACRLTSPVWLACEAAANALRGVLAEETNSARKIQELQEQIREREGELAGLTETNLTQLREALSAAEGVIDADRTFAAAQLEAKRLSRETADQHRQIGGVGDGFDLAAKLPVPAVATIRQFKEQLDELHREIALHQAKVNEIQARAENLQGDLARFQRNRKLPSPQDLLEARQHRDYGWALVLAAWKGPAQPGELVPQVPLEKAFPEAIQKADEIADRLRDQADAVAQAEEKRMQMAEAQKQLSQATAKIAELQTALLERRHAWETQWAPCSITPRSPAEMIEWREQWSAFRERLAKLRTLEDSLALKTAQINLGKQRLAAALGESIDKEFSLLFQQAKSQVQEAEERRGRRGELTKQLNRFRTELNKVVENRAGLLQSMQSAAERWKSQCLAVNLPEMTGPDAGLALLRERNELLTKFDQWLEVSGQLQLTTRRIDEYEQAVARTAASLALAGDSTLGLESVLWNALTDARKLQATRAGLQKQIDQLQEKLAVAQRNFADAQRALHELLALAQVPDASALEPFLAHLEQRDQLRHETEQLCRNLVGLARNPVLDEFITQVRSHNPSEWPERKVQLEQEKAAALSALASVRERVFHLAARKAELEKAGDAAANFRQQAESCAATVREDARRYLRLRLAIHLLETQIKRFREENQGPLLKRSGELFSAITRGAFSGLTADINADDEPILAAVRPTGAKVLVEGLSDGTRDQLYLALRLAALDRHLQDHEPMPLILDDLLITFDNDRAQAILPQLADLAQRTQVFLFTHHQHLVDLCHQTLGDSQFQLHALGR